MKMLLLLLSVFVMIALATAVTSTIIQPKLTAPQLRIDEDKERYPVDIIDENCLRLRTNVTAITEKATLRQETLTLEQSALLALNQLPLKVRGETIYKDYTKEIIFCHNMIVGEYKWGFNSTVIEITNVTVGVTNFTSNSQDEVALSADNNSLVTYFPFDYGIADHSETNKPLYGGGYEINENCFNSSGCLYLDDTDVLVSDSDVAQNVSSRLTIMAWYYIEDMHLHDTKESYIVKGTSTTTNLGSYWLTFVQNNSGFGVSNGTDAVSSLGDFGTPDNKWYHLAGSYNGTHIQVFHNGTLSYTQSAPLGDLQDLDDGFLFGNLAASSNYNISFKNVRVYNVTLFESDINKIYNDEAANYIEPRYTAGTYHTEVNALGTDSVVNNVTYDCRESDGNNCSISLMTLNNSQAVEDFDIIAWWGFDDQNIMDYSGRGHNGTMYGDYTISGTTNVRGSGGLYIDKTWVIADNNPNYVEVPDHDDFNFGAGVGDCMTFMFWFTPNGNSFGDQNRLFNKGTQMRFDLDKNGANSDINVILLDADGAGSVNERFSYTNYLIDGEPIMVTTVVCLNDTNEQHVYFYVNDTFLSDQADNEAGWTCCNNQADNLFIGNRDAVDGDEFNGTVDDLLFFNTTLTGDEISDWYNGVYSTWRVTSKNDTNTYHPPQYNATHAQLKFYLDGNGTTSTLLNMNISASDSASFPATGPAVVTGDLDLLFTNATDTSIFKTVYQEGENFRFWWNWSYSTNSSPITNETGECNFTVDDVYIEDEGLVDFTLCDAGQGCTQDNPYLGEFELEYTNVTEQITEDLISIDICHTQQISAGLVMTVECTDHQQLFIVNKNEFARCSDGFSTVQRQPDICKNNTLINVTLQNTANTYPKSHNISDWDYDRRLAQHTDSYSEGEITFNFTRNLWFYEDSYEQYDHGTVELNVTCYSAVDTNLNQTTSEQITIVNRAPIITFLDVIIQGTTYALVEGVTLEYNKGQYNWTIAVEDDDLTLINYTIYNNSVQVLSNQSTGVLANQSTGVLDFTTPDGLFRYLGVYNITVWANDTNFNRTEESITFISNDTTPPYAEILYPLDSSIVITQEFDINATAEDNRTEELDFFWVVNGTVNSTGVNENSTLNASNGYYNLTLFVFDGVQNGSHTVYFTVNNESTDFLPPDVTLNYPTDGLTIEGLGVDFNCSATDNSSLNLATLWGNWSGVYQANQTNSTTVANATYIFSEPLLPQGGFVWNCVICDIYSNCASYGSNYTFTMGYPPFNITIEDYSMEWIRLNWT